MKFLSLLALACCGIAVASCSSDPASPEKPNVVYTIPGIGSEYDMSWIRFDQGGSQLPSSNNDTTVRIFAKDTVVNDRPGVTAFAFTDPNYPGVYGEKLFTRINASNDLEVLFDSDDLSFERWVTLPIQTRGAKVTPIDTVIEELRAVGTMSVQYQGTSVEYVGGSNVEVYKIKIVFDIDGVVNSNVVATIDETRTLWYAPSLGFFTLIEAKSTGVDIDGDPQFGHTKQELQRYRLQ